MLPALLEASSSVLAAAAFASASATLSVSEDHPHRLGHFLTWTISKGQSSPRDPFPGCGQCPLPSPKELESNSKVPMTWRDSEVLLLSGLG